MSSFLSKKYLQLLGIGFCGHPFRQQQTIAPLAKGISQKAFVAKLSIAFEEIDESLFWLECILDLKLHPTYKMEAIIKEATELANMLASARKIFQAKATIKS